MNTIITILNDRNMHTCNCCTYSSRVEHRFATIPMSSMYALCQEPYKIEDRFATVPMHSMYPVFEQANEDELHTSFEEAISERAARVSKQLDKLSGSLPSRSCSGTIHDTRPLKAPDTEPLESLFEAPLWESRGWQLRVRLISLALLLMLTGFDVMGLLILHTHL